MDLPIRDDKTTTRSDCFGSVLEALPAWVRTTSYHAPEFWEQQRLAILARIPVQPPRARPAIPRSAWAFALGVLATATLLIISGPETPKSFDAQSDPDREWLIRAEYAVTSGGPQALEPAALLAEEIGRRDHNTVSTNRKEVDDEE
jgi:hypothetical protein